MGATRRIINSLKPETRRALYLVVAKTGGGWAAISRSATWRRGARWSCLPKIRSNASAPVFRAAARVGAADFATGPALLREVDRARLPSGDQPLYDAAALVSARIFRAPETRFSSPPSGAANSVDAVLARADRSVTDADAAMDSVAKSMERKTR